VGEKLKSDFSAPSLTGKPVTGTPWPFGDLKKGHYRAILADPPWAFDLHSDKGYDKSPEAHYSTMSLTDIKALPVHELAARRSILIMWVTWPMMDQAIELMRSWGFVYKTGGPWVKRTVNWKPAFGTGFIFRSATEAFILGTRGAAMAGTRSQRNLIETEDAIFGDLDGFEIDALRREHSRKPDQMRELVDRLVAGGPACELFAREPWAGRDVWGNEVEKFAPPLIGKPLTGTPEKFGGEV
jgi:N6-adenosine-specific RNA methylase IME4